MFQTIQHERTTNQVLLAVAAALLAVSVYVTIQIAAVGVPRVDTHVQGPAAGAAAGPPIDDNSTHIREFRAGHPF